MENKNLTINISTGTVLKVIALVLILAFVWFIRDILLLVFISIIFAAIIEPIVNSLEDKSVKLFKREIPRGIIVIFIYLVLFLFLFLVVRMIIPPIVEQLALLTSNFPDLWSKILQNFQGLQQYSQDQGLADNIQESLKGLQTGLESAAGGVYSFIVAIFRSVVNFMLVLVIIFYLVMEKDPFGKMMKAVAPVQYHAYLINLFSIIQKKIGAWARGQLMLGLIIGVLSFIGLLFLMPKYALVLALVAAVTELVPYLGPILGAIPAIFLGFAVPPYSLWRGVAILILYVVIQQVEEKVIVPQVMKKQLGLNPVVIIIVMLIGFRLAGIIGLILAIPVATSIGVIVKDFISKSGLPKLKEDTDKQD
ncbi:MAG: hypothetical protein CMI53_03755 [Parcubacteria group bacterium]|nr:hypothetical protein [Parcubacteria group bacterium]|tara:strand:+ start:156 stop:1247 length:1092 start_codon:yes stop_codon:yes gene_type:complete